MDTVHTEDAGRPIEAPVEACPAADETQHEIVLEQPFAGYQVVEKIGQGGMAAVFRAKDLRLNREVAIKALIPNMENNQDAVDCFFNEARNVARLRHPHVVRGLDVGRAGKYFYFAMEYIRGETLCERLDRLERSRVTEEITLRIVRDVANGLQYVFEQGLVHRDIKPGNIMLSNNGPAMLIDLGVAKEVAYESLEAVVKGSPSYASPEQVRGDLNIDIRADLYGLGCTWYHMLVGVPPYRGSTAEMVMKKHLEEPIPNVRDENIRISAATAQLVQWLMAKDRDERPRTPQEFLNKLSEHPLLQTDPGSDELEKESSDEENPQTPS